MKKEDNELTGEQIQIAKDYAVDHDIEKIFTVAKETKQIGKFIFDYGVDIAILPTLKKGKAKPTGAPNKIDAMIDLQKKKNAKRLAEISSNDKSFSKAKSELRKTEILARNKGEEKETVKITGQAQKKVETFQKSHLAKREKAAKEFEETHNVSKNTAKENLKIKASK